MAVAEDVDEVQGFMIAKPMPSEGVYRLVPPARTAVFSIEKLFETDPSADEASGHQSRGAVAEAGQRLKTFARSRYRLASLASFVSPGDDNKENQTTGTPDIELPSSGLTRGSIDLRSSGQQWTPRVKPGGGTIGQVSQERHLDESQDP